MFYHWQVITVTGYTGTERTLLKNMIYVIGAKYTGYLTRVNTHIICKRYAVIYTVSYMYFCVTVIQLWSVYSVIGFDQKIWLQWRIEFDHYKLGRRALMRKWNSDFLDSAFWHSTTEPQRLCGELDYQCI